MLLLSSALLFVFFIFSAFVLCLTTAQQETADEQTQNKKQKTTTTSITFPDAFVVSTGTTIPFLETDPISQSGQIFFDLEAQKMRINHNWLGHQRSFIVDLKRERGYLLSDTNCVTSRIQGKLLPMSVPATAIRDAEPQLVRHVPVIHYQSFERGESHLNQLDHYVRQQNLTAVLDDGSETSISFFMPWRSETRRSDRRELAAPPRSRPNWRYFGEEFSNDDQLEQISNHFENKVARVLTRDVVVTVDFYDFAPIRPDDSTFAPPGQCAEEVYTETFAHDVDVHEAQRLLTELSFNTQAGQKIIDEINNQARRKRIAADDHHQH